MTPLPSDPYHGFVLSGARRALALEGAVLGDALEGEELTWAHLPFDPEDPQGVLDWLAAHVPGLDATTCRALTGDATRPRAIAAGHGLMVILRGVNLNAGAEPEDMVTCRLYLDERRVVTLSRRPLGSISALADKIAAGQGPETPAGFLHDLGDALIERIEDMLEQSEEETDDLEDRVEDPVTVAEYALRSRAEAMRLRRIVMILRRHIAPQRDAFATAATQAPQLIDAFDARRLVEIEDRHRRAVEELDGLAGRLTLIRDQIRSEQDERTNRNLYFLSVISALFLPLGFLTGLLGVNLGGIPGSDTPWGFPIFCILLVLVFAAQIALLRRL